MNKYKPRNDFVVVREEAVEFSEGGLAMPGTSAAGKRFIVEAVGPKVDDLEPGDEVMMTGQPGVDWATIPREGKLVVIREGNVVLVVDPSQDSPYEKVVE